MNTPAKSKTEKPDGQRLARAIARAGICSRREAEKLIAQGRVTVNRRVVTSPALNVTADDKVMVDGETLPMEQPARLWRFHKPTGLVTSTKDPEGRRTVFDALPPTMPRVISIGRLDIATEGLMLFTNDGDLARHLELPATGWVRRYRVRCYGRVGQPALDKLKGGITIDGIHYGAIDAKISRETPSHVWIEIAIREGKNREVRKVMETLNLQVTRLIRLSFGPFQLGDMKVGEVVEVPGKVLAEQLGGALPKTGATAPKRRAGKPGKPALKPGKPDAHRRRNP